MRISGRLKYSSRTKNLVKRLEPGDLAVIDHADIDELAAKALLKCGVAAVVNFADSLTGRYPCPGPRLLLEAGIPLMDRVDPGLRQVLEVKQSIKGCLVENGIAVGGHLFAGTRRDLDWVEESMEKTHHRMQTELIRFVENTLEYAQREVHDILKPQQLPSLRTPIRGQHVLVVVRGKSYREDLEAIRGYLMEVRPVLIGVDGGADALINMGYKPHIIVGDMDSVSDAALRSGAELVVHAYPDGRAPGCRRLDGLGCSYVTMPVQGTSEDAALLLAHDRGAELIVALGTHTSAVDFLEKGRPGMASTLLVRLKVAQKLVDAKGVSQLYRRRFYGRYAAALGLCAMIPVGALVAVVTPLQLYIRLLLLKFRLLTGL